MRRVWSLILISSILMTCAGCTGITFGPQTKVQYVIARAGHPALVVENREVLVLPEGADAPVKQDLGGGYWMPAEHFDSLMRALPKSNAPKTPDAVEPSR